MSLSHESGIVFNLHLAGLAIQFCLKCLIVVLFHDVFHYSLSHNLNGCFAHTKDLWIMIGNIQCMHKLS
jgi:hypothetical protein